MLVDRRVLSTIALATLLAGCGPPPPTAAPSERWDAHLAPLIGADIVVLSPHDPNDQQFLRALLAEVGGPPEEGFLWPAGPADAGGRTFEDIVAEVEGADTRRHMRDCLRFVPGIDGPPRPGIVVLRLRIDGEGDVLESTVLCSTVDSPDLLGCLMENAMAWRLGRTRQETHIDVALAVVPVAPDADPVGLSSER